MNASIDDFSTNWEFRKGESKYHFDSTVDDSQRDDIKYNWLRFQGDWSEDLNNFVADMPPPHDLQSKQIRNSVQECLNLGLNYMWTLGQRSEVTVEKYPTIYKIVEKIGLKNSLGAIHRQKPGMVSWSHLDVLCSFHQERESQEEEKKLVRLFVALNDWKSGHFFSLANQVWHQWRAGDTCWYSWQDIPHSTANASLSDRITLKITGEWTEAFQANLDSNERIIQIN